MCCALEDPPGLSRGAAFNPPGIYPDVHDRRYVLQPKRRLNYLSKRRATLFDMGSIYFNDDRDEAFVVAIGSMN